MNDSTRINVLLIGGGGREHALARAIADSPKLGRLHITHPKNPGLAKLGTQVDVPVSKAEIYRLAQYCDKHKIGLVVIGPEDPLAQGFADALATKDRLVFGPNQQAATLEADKVWAKQLMRSASIPTAESRDFTNLDRAIAYVESREEPPVLKAAGLAAGKGVALPASMDEAVAFLTDCLGGKKFGDAGRKVLIEERLSGPEVSILSLVDGRNIYVLETAQDHKRLKDNDEGPNTGGMGAFSPSTRIDERTMDIVQREILVPTIDALKREGIDYRGVLYAGLMLTPAGPKVLEYNVRFGDPECQAILPRLKSDFIDVCLATCTGKLSDIDIEFDERPSCCVVLASDGYPESPKKGDIISGIPEAEAVDDVVVYHAGTALDEKGNFITNGGRVLSVVAVGDTPKAAHTKAYEAASKISFAGMQMRTDIGG
ncbi:MAG: phosphoribosylamine--glycine ligase [Phycisphaerales bacterium]